MRVALLGLLSFTFACNPGERPPVEDCFDPAGSADVAGPDSLRTFRKGEGGAGVFGAWVVGPGGLPEYAYTLDQANDARAGWPNTEDEPRRDHWHLVGNRRLDAAVFNDGYAVVSEQQHGHQLVTRFDPATRNFGGGFSIVAVDDGAPFSSAHRYRSPDAQSGRWFGMGYARMTTCRAELRVERTLSAPPGDRAWLADTVVLENRTGRALRVRHFEVWDVNRHVLSPQLLRSGTLNPSLPDNLDRERDAKNEKFVQRAVADATWARVTQRLIMPMGALPRSEPAEEDLFPPDLFLVDLDGASSRFHTDGGALWGADGDPSRPASLQPGMLAPSSALGQPAVLLAEREVTLEPRARATLRYAFGAVAQNGALPMFETVDHTAEVRRALPYFDATGEAQADAWKREMAWHAYYLEALGGWQEYFQHATVNQGGAYFWLHGLDGAVRDFVFSVAALSYIDPALARETLRYAARMRFESSRALAYSTDGVGRLSTAVIHARPSDLELFFWWGLAEYVFATGDRALLDEEEPFWPKAQSTMRPLFEHVRVGTRYLVDDIGVGPHGLLKLGDGDWDDSITFYAPSREVAIQDGESVANAAMAALVMPWAAALVEERDATTASELRTVGAAQRARLAAEWTGEWYRRAWFGPQAPFGDQQLFLLPNAFALAADVPGASEAATLTANLKAHLEDPSQIGLVQAWFREKPMSTQPGVTDEGGSNPAITALGIWGYFHADPARAWAAFGKSTMARKAERYPSIWYGIWSGPDSQYTEVSKLAGQTWASQATPTTDYPIMNSNQHAGVLLGMLRASGIEPAVRTVMGRETGCLRIAPPRPYELDLPLVRLGAQPGRVRGEYRAVADGNVCLAVKPQGASEQVIVLPTRRGMTIPFDVSP